MQHIYIDRIVTQKIRSLLEDFPAVVISGARQVGKSTLLQHVFGQEADYVVFEEFLDVENVRKDPEFFLRQHPKRPLILDEIQYVPELVSTLKRYIDRNPSPGQFLLTGSQQWSVMKSLSESLTGRAAFVDLEGFCLSEIANQPFQKSWLQQWLDSPAEFLTEKHERLNLNYTVLDILWRGGLPQAYFIKPENLPDFFLAYLRTYIERDVRSFADVLDWQLFGRFVGLSAALTAQEINYSQLGRDLGLTPQTARRWLAMLKATFQWFEVPAFSGNPVKRISGKPKGYFADTGLACALQAISSPKALGTSPLLGRLFETAVVGQIRKLSAVLSGRPILHHWRTLRGAEVDLLLERDGRFYPIEIKVAGVPSRSDVSGIAAFRKTYPNLQIEKGLVICPVEKIMALSDEDYAVPWDLL
ncbi:MAG: ATP-binding protein [Anaerohalosphaeraceae bacterium]